MKRHYRAVFFDIDGTLVDSNEFHVAAWEQAFREASFPVDRATLRQQIGKGADMLLPALAPALSKTDQELIADRQGKIFSADYLARVQPFPHARDLLVALHKKGLKVLLASSAKQDEVDHYVELLDAGSVICGTTSGDDVERTKPAGDIFLSALAKVSPIAASEVVAIGDTPYDAEAAGKAQIITLAVLSGGFPEASLRDAGAVDVYESVGDLLENLAQSVFRSLSS